MAVNGEIAGTRDAWAAACRDELTRLASVIAACQLALHCWAASSARDPQMALMHVVALLYDLFLLTTITCGLHILVKLVPAAWRAPFRYGALAVVVSLGIALACYPLLLADFLAFPVNIFAVDESIVRFFVANLLGWQGALAIAATALLAGLSLSGILSFPVPRSKRLMRILVVVCVGGITLGLAGWRRLEVQPHPLIYSAQETLRDFADGGRRVVPPLARPAALRASADQPLEASPLAAAQKFRYDHVFLLVMETVNEGDFAKDLLGQEDGFCSRMIGRAAYFPRYYTTNLDSYTSLLAMLTSVQVPYRAYASPRYYAHVNEAPSMVQALRAAGWQSLFVCTAMHQPFIPVHDQWNLVLQGRDLQSDDGWVSVDTNAVEAAWEDRAALDSMISHACAHRRTLVMHEMVYGHSPRWAKLTGKRQLQYYDDFFQELYDRLDVADLADTSLFVIVADHGSRVDSAVPENYHVPLLIVGREVEPGTDEAMYSHLDLQQLVGHYLCDLPRPKPRGDVLVVGHSARWVYGQITCRGESLFIDALNGVVLSQTGGLAASHLFASFQGQIDMFARYVTIPASR